MILKTSFCVDLRTAAQVIAFLNLVQAGLLIFAGNIVFVASEQTEHGGDRVLEMYSLSVPLFVLLVDGLLFYGINEKKRYYMLPWLILGAATLVVISAANIWSIIAVSPSFTVGLAVLALAWYIWFSIFSYYEFLGQRIENVELSSRLPDTDIVYNKFENEA